MDKHWKTVEATAEYFGDDGIFPNSQLPLLLYRQAIDPKTPALAAAIEGRLAANHWTNAWRNGVYSFPHYHSTAHEVLAVNAGRARVQLGGPVLGTTFELAAGDLVVLPAGLAHENLGASADFAVIGAYPDGQHWDLLRGNPEDRPQADENIAAVPLPTCDPLYGAEGPLRLRWRPA